MSKMLTIEETAKELKVSTKTLYRWDFRGYFVPTIKKPNIRLYDSQVVEYWRMMLNLDRDFKRHLKLLDELRARLNKYNLEQNYVPGKNLKFLTDKDVKHFSDACEAMEKWNIEYKKMLNQIIEYPTSMLKAITEE